MRSPEDAKKRQLTVGAFIILGIAVFFTFSLKMTDSPIFRSGSKVSVYLADATGIFVNSKVKLAGIDVGIVDKIELEGQQAKITMTIDEGVELPDPPIIVPKPLGVLGDKYLEIQRATIEDLREDQLEETPDGAWYKPVLDIVLPTANAQKKSTPSRSVKTGEVLRSRDQSAALDDLMRDVSKLSQDLKIITKEVREILAGNRTNIDKTLTNFNRVSTELVKLSDKLADEDVRSEIEKLSESVLKLNQTIQNIESISAKVERGEGTLGKLVNDSETIDRVNETLASVNSTVDRARRLRTHISFDSQYLGQTEEIQTQLNLSFFTSYDFSYVVGLSLDDYGSVEEKITTSQTDSNPVSTTTETIRKPTSVKFNFLLYKKFPNFALAGGMIENTGGVHFELFNRSQSLKLRASFYNFSSDTNVHSRFLLSYNPWGVLNVSGGYYHLLESGASDSRKSWTLGLGLSFDDEDLKTLLLIPGLG